jgi:hypothetical protein
MWKISQKFPLEHASLDILKCHGEKFSKISIHAFLFRYFAMSCGKILKNFHKVTDSRGFAPFTNIG